MCSSSILVLARKVEFVLFQCAAHGHGTVNSNMPNWINSLNSLNSRHFEKQQTFDPGSKNRVALLHIVTTSLFYPFLISMPS